MLNLSPKIIFGELVKLIPDDYCFAFLLWFSQIRKCFKALLICEVRDHFTHPYVVLLSSYGKCTSAVNELVEVLSVFALF